MITVSYLIEIDRDDFWLDGQLQPEIDQEIQKRFPKEFKLKGNLPAERQKLMYIPIDGLPNTKRFPSCGRWMIDPSKPNYLFPLRIGKELAGSLYCENCEWELRSDLEQN